MKVPTTPDQQGSSTSTLVSWRGLFWGLLIPLIVIAARSLRELIDTTLPFDTEFTYLPMARQILEDPNAYWRSEVSIRAAPGIPAIMALANADVINIKMMNFGMTLLSVVMMFHISLRLAGWRAAACTTWLLMLAAPNLTTLMVRPQAEASALFFTVLWLWITAWCLDRNSSKATVICTALCAGLVLGLLTLTRATFMYWIPAVALFSCMARFTPRLQQLGIPWLRLTTIHVIALVCVGAYLTKNAIDFGKPMIATGAGAALYFGNLPTTHGQEPPFFGLQHDEVTNTGGIDHLSILGDRRLTDAAKAILADRPLTETAGLYWNKAGSFLLFSKSHLRNYSDRSLRILLIVFALVGLWLARRHSLALMLGALVLYMTAIHLPALYNPRYSIGAIGIELILLAGMGMGLLSNGRYSTRAWVIGTALACVLLGAAHQRYSRPILPDADVVPLALLNESKSDQIKTRGFQSDPFTTLSELSGEMANIVWANDNFPEIDGFSLLSLKVSQLEGECTKAWLQYTNAQGTTRRDMARISSLHEAQDFNRGMQHLFSPGGGGRIELSLQCKKGTRMKLESMRILRGSPGMHYRKLSEAKQTD